MEKLTKQFADMYRNTLRVKGFSEPEQKTNSYICRLERMYTSEKYQEYSIYPSMGIDKIFAVIAICLELNELGESDAEIIEFVNTGLNLHTNT